MTSTLFRSVKINNRFITTKKMKQLLYIFHLLVSLKDFSSFPNERDVESKNYSKYGKPRCTIGNQTSGIHMDCSYRNLTRVPSCEDLLIGCSIIKYLNLRKNQLTEIKEGSFANFTKLTTLDISFNPILHLENKSFEGLKSLHTLIAEDMGPWTKIWPRVCKMELDVFKETPLLDSLDFTHSLLDVRSFFPSTCGLPKRIKMLNLNLVFRGGPWILTNEHTKCLKNKYIKILKLNKNFLVLLEPYALLNLKHSEELSLKQNDIQNRGSEFLLFAAFHNISVLDFTCQTRLHCLKQDSPLLAKVNLTTAESNVAVSREKGSWHKQDQRIKLYFLGKLISLRLSQAVLKVQILNFHLYNICWVNNVTELDTSYTGVIDIIGTFPCMDKLRKFNIRQIYSGYLDPRFFHEMPSLEVLQMGGSAPASTFDSNTSHLLFMKNRHLKFLDLSNNGITTMNSSVLSPLKLLTAIDLHGNEISDPSFLPLISLRYVVLSKNRLKQIPIKIINHLETFYHSGLETLLDISGNMFLCSCSMMEDLQRINKTTVKIANKQSLRCTITAGGGEINFTEASSILNEKCRKGDKTCIIFLTVIYPFSLLVIATVATLLRYRWEVRHAWYAVKLLQEREMIQNKDTSKYAFDAFVCYCCKDHKWVFNQLIPTLEGGENPYKLCIHDRNFRPGAYIAENILAAIESSRITIIVVSRSFTRSKWCDFEVNAAQHHHLRGIHKNIIAVVLPSYNKNEGSHLRSLSNLLNTVTYISWPNEKEGQKLVWLKLRKAMGKPGSIENNVPSFLLN